jgi:hypothetical protein
MRTDVVWFLGAWECLGGPSTVVRCAPKTLIIRRGGGPFFVSHRLIAGRKLAEFHSRASPVHR